MCMMCLQVNGQFDRGFCEAKCHTPQKPTDPASYSCSCPVHTSLARLQASIARVQASTRSVNSSNAAGAGAGEAGGQGSASEGEGGAGGQGSAGAVEGEAAKSGVWCVHTYTAAWLSLHHPLPATSGTSGAIGVIDRSAPFTTGRGI